MIRATRWVPAFAVVMAVTGCGQAVTGTPAPDPADVQQATDRLFETAGKAGKEFMSDVAGRATAYWYITFANAQRGTESAVSLLGDNPEFVETRQSKLDPTLKLTIYHPSGAAVDLVKLDGKFAQVAPTPWVSHPTYYRSLNTITCSYPAIETLCKIENARIRTEEANPPGLTRQATVLPDGAVELRSGATVKALIDTKVLKFSDELARQLTVEMTRAIVPLKIVLDQDRKLRSVEVAGEVAGKPTPLQVQIGFERRGPAAKADFPAAPQPAEITAIPDEQGRSEFWNKIG